MLVLSLVALALEVSEVELHSADGLVEHPVLQVLQVRQVLQVLQVLQVFLMLSVLLVTVCD